MQQSGYSGTPLAKKLGLKNGYSVLLVNQPAHYLDLFTDFPDVALIEHPKETEIDFIHFFGTSKKDMEKQTVQLKPFLKNNGTLWVSWPKKSSKIASDLSRDYIREHLLANGLVDVKVCAVDKDWSGLKFVYRLKDRK